jgi:hypothetical protein
MRLKEQQGRSACKVADLICSDSESAILVYFLLQTESKVYVEAIVAQICVQLSHKNGLVSMSTT